ncbi:MAG TPA: InlB B-repeat-containing protein [Acidimicrobiales bacterium]|jgi:uncharacterized repeat protein (TIGR02543 family)|nr:InlB B-repeat-containing protein [Acidimicrobiales bacterium]
MISDHKTSMKRVHVLTRFLAVAALFASVLTVSFESVATADNVPSSVVAASPHSVAADGSTTSTITVTLDSQAGATDMVSLEGTTANSSRINGGAAGALATVAASGFVATFTVTDHTSESVTYQAIDLTDGNQVVTSQDSVAFTPVVTFNANGGTGSIASETNSVAAALTANTMTRVGYSFAGWNTDPGGGGTSYADGASFPFNTSANTTLYAQWSDITEATGFPVETETLGGASIPVTLQKVGDLVIFQSQIHSQTINITSVSATGTGATGTWTRSKQFIDSTNGTGITEEIWWAKVTTVGATTITATYSASVAALSPELIADSFTSANQVSWRVVNVNASTSGGTTTTSVAFPSVASSTGSDQLYWGYTESTQSALPGNTPNFSYTAIPATGNLITFNDQLGASASYAPNATNSSLGNYSAIATIFAATPVSNSVTFNANSGVGTMANEASTGAANLTTNTFTRPGYTFTGWNTINVGGGTAYADGASYTFAAPLTLYAQWSANATATVTFNAGAGTGSMTAQTTNTPTALTANAFTNGGLVFKSWNTALNGTGTAYANGGIYPFATSTTLYAQWAVAPATVTFSSNGGTGSMNPETDNVAEPLNVSTFTRVGYTFSGWNTQANGLGTAYADNASYPFTSSTTLYAQWTANASFTVTFNGNNATGGAMTPQVANSPTALTLNSFTRAGYNFAGWNTIAAGGGTAYADGATYPFTANVILYAQWTAVGGGGGGGGGGTTYTVTFSPNGGTGSMSPETSGVAAALTANAFTYTGFTFAGWNTMANGSGTAYPNFGNYPFTSSVTLYAQWTAVATTTTTTTTLPPVITTVSTHTALSLSKTKVPFASQHAVEFTIHVTPRGSQRAFRGVVKIKVGSRIVCTARVSSNGVARCALPAKALKKGSYTVVAIYGGDSNARPSTSVVGKLTIL